LGAIPAETVPVLAASSRVLAEVIRADRDYPPFLRSARDGLAVRAADLPGELHIVGEVRAGTVFEERLSAGQAVEIMTGAPLPDGADQVVMVEHAERHGDRVKIARPSKPGDNFSARGEEAAAGSIVLAPGSRLDYSAIATLAMMGRGEVRVYRKPRVSILPTGDELVEVHETPAPFQIRNSNAWSLAAQVERAGGVPQLVGLARDNYASTRSLLEQALAADLVLLSGGVSVGKYDIVERVLADLGAGFFFTHADIQPGRPVVFGYAQGKFFFGLPGNPGSTMATFELFARPALELLGGLAEPTLPLLRARLTRDFSQKTGLTRFLPACLSSDGAEVTPLASHGSGDVPALARANAYLVTDPGRERWRAGDDIRVMLK
jgi:molybdopterin molybdotransferase